MIKKETIEEVAKIYAELNQYDLEYYDEGGCQGIEVDSFAKKLVDFTTRWQAEKMYSEEEVKYLLYAFKNYIGFGDEVNEEEWFEQFKKQ